MRGQRSSGRVRVLYRVRLANLCDLLVDGLILYSVRRHVRLLRADLQVTLSLFRFTCKY